MKLYFEEIEVFLGEEGQPVTLRWRHGVYAVVKVYERWQYNGKWWKTPNLQGECRNYYRIAVAPSPALPLQMEIFECGGRWMLSRLLD